MTYLSELWGQCLLFICACSLGPHQYNVRAVDHMLWFYYQTGSQHQRPEMTDFPVSFLILSFTLPPLSEVWSQCLLFLCACTLGPHRGNVWAVDHDLWLSYPTVNHQKCEVSVCASSLFVLWDHTKAKWAVDHTFWFSDCTYQKCEVSVCSSSVFTLWAHTKAMDDLLIMPFDSLNCTWKERKYGWIPLPQMQINFPQ